MSLIAGFLTGIAASMGLGGGFVLIVYLTLFGNVPQLKAQGANLLFFLPIALFSTILNTKNGLVEWRSVPFAAAAGMIGAAAGAVLSGLIDESLLRKLFAVLLALTAVRELFHKGAGKNGEEKRENHKKARKSDKKIEKKC